VAIALNVYRLAEGGGALPSPAAAKVESESSGGGAVMTGAAAAAGYHLPLVVAMAAPGAHASHPQHQLAALPSTTSDSGSHDSFRGLGGAVLGGATAGVVALPHAATNTAAAAAYSLLAGLTIPAAAGPGSAVAALPSPQLAALGGAGASRSVGQASPQALAPYVRHNSSFARSSHGGDNGNAAAQNGNAAGSAWGGANGSEDGEVDAAGFTEGMSAALGGVGSGSKKKRTRNEQQMAQNRVAQVRLSTVGDCLLLACV
jgi:hypothetical protein